MLPIHSPFISPTNLGTITHKGDKVGKKAPVAVPLHFEDVCLQGLGVGLQLQHADDLESDVLSMEIGNTVPLDLASISRSKRVIHR